MIFFSVIKQYERAVVFKLGKVTGEARGPESTQRAMARQAEAGHHCRRARRHLQPTEGVNEWRAGAR
jgi:hypothetical protein